jgi:hypothetical protein
MGLPHRPNGGRTASTAAPWSQIGGVIERDKGQICSTVEVSFVGVGRASGIA